MWDIRQQANHSAKNFKQKGKLVMQNSKLENATPNVFFSVQLIKNGYEYWVLNNCFRCNFEDNRILQWWSSQVYLIDKNCHFVYKTGRGILECSHHIFVVIMMMSSRNTLPNYLANTIKKNIYTLRTYTVSENPSKSPINTMFENHRKSLIQHSERSELRLHFSGQKYTKNAKNGQFWRVFENQSLRSNSVTR